MLRTAGALVAIFGTIFGGAYVLDKLSKYKEKMIENQENDEVELEKWEWYQLDLEEYMKEQQEDEKECCGCCEHCECHNNKEE